MLKENQIDYKGGKISFFTKGKGRAVIFLHGFLLEKSIWTDLAADFPKKYRIICIDLPAHGNSSTYNYFNSMAFMADAVKAVVDHLRLKKYVLIGHSLGGYVTLAFAEKYTDHLLGLVLINSTAKADNKKRSMSRRKMISVIKDDKAKGVRLLIPTLFHSTRWRRYRNEINKITKSAGLMSHRAIISTIEGMMKRKESEIVVKFAPYPILYLIGAKDKILSMESLIEEAKLNELASYYVLEDCGHMCMLEAENKSRRIIVDFLNSIDSQ